MYMNVYIHTSEQQLIKHALCNLKECYSYSIRNSITQDIISKLVFFQTMNRGAHFLPMLWLGHVQQNLARSMCSYVHMGRNGGSYAESVGGFSDLSLEGVYITSVHIPLVRTHSHDRFSCVSRKRKTKVLGLAGSLSSRYPPG